MGMSDELAKLNNVIAGTGFPPELFADLIEYIQKNAEYIEDLDSRINCSLTSFNQWDMTLERIQQLAADRHFVSGMASYFNALYHGAKLRGLPPKTKKGVDERKLTEAEREAYQSAYCSPYILLKEGWQERIKTIDRICVTLNKVLERENHLLNRRDYID